MEEYPVYTASELMVMLSVSGGTELCGFFPERNPTRQEIIAATGRLMRRGLLTAGESGDFEPVPGPAAGLIRAMCRPELVVYVTPTAEDQPQVCFAFDALSATGYESVLVQEGAVRLFPVTEGDWIRQLRERGLLSEEELPEGRRRVFTEEMPFDVSLQQLAEKWDRGTALIEFRRPGTREPERRVYLRDGAGEVQAVVMTRQGCRATNDPAWAVRLRDWQMEENGNDPC